MISLPLRLMTTRSPFLFVTVLTLMNVTLPGFVDLCFDCSETRDAVPPTWKLLMVSYVPGSPIDSAALPPTLSAILTRLPLARLRPQPRRQTPSPASHP